MEKNFSELTEIKTLALLAELANSMLFIFESFLLFFFLSNRPICIRKHILKHSGAPSCTCLFTIKTNPAPSIEFAVYYLFSVYEPDGLRHVDLVQE